MILPVMIFAYVANLLLYTDEVGSMTSGYPRRMYTLPVTTATLVFWPMLFAAVAVVSLWFIVALLVYRPRRLSIRRWFCHALALAVGVAWCQAIGWSPVKSQLVRVLDRDHRILDSPRRARSTCSCSKEWSPRPRSRLWG